MAGAAVLEGMRRSSARLLSTFWATLRDACVAAYRDNCLGIAKGAAYSALLSFFPVMTSVTAILVQARAQEVSKKLLEALFVVVPPGTHEIVMYTFTRRGARPVSLIVIAVLVSLWAASGVMLSLMEGFRAAYKVPRGRPFLKQRGMAALLVLCAMLPVLLASALVVFGERAERLIVTWVGLLPEGQQLGGWVQFFGYIARYVIAFSAIVLGTALLYYLGPNLAKRMRHMWPGAILAAVLWWLATVAFGWYVSNIAHYNVLYGSIGAVIALLVWMYLLSVIALIGCEFNAVRDRMDRDGAALRRPRLH
ncbi:MAG: YihY/virulence factor BrkB family protein [Acidobacteria bacterium]|nr:YihY/virulence factor BrkB family protein [Acidobacteriota bacterium]